MSGRNKKNGPMDPTELQYERTMYEVAVRRGMARVDALQFAAMQRLEQTQVRQLARKARRLALAEGRRRAEEGERIE